MVLQCAALLCTALRCAALDSRFGAILCSKYKYTTACALCKALVVVVVDKVGKVGKVRKVREGASVVKFHAMQ